MKSTCSTVFIHTPCYELLDDRLEPPLGLLYLATWLNQHGYEARVVDLSSIPPALWEERIPQAEVYGFSTYTTNYHRTLEILSLVKKIFPLARTVAGGPHASALPELVARHFDYVVVGEGEQAILRLLSSLEAHKSIPPILVGEPVPNLDELPFPDYALVDLASYHRVVGGRASVSILTSRGCPYQCVFCNSIVMGGGNLIRFRTAANVMAELQQLKTAWGYTSFRFQDDNFIINMPRLREITPSLAEAAILYRCFGRADRCSCEVANLLYQGGCRHIAFGIESGSDPILERMRKGQTSADIRRGIYNSRNAGLTVRAYLMVGFPGETWETVQETVDLMLECEPDEFTVYPLIPYPGTLLYQEPERFGITSINPDFLQYFQVRKDRMCGYVFRTADLDEGKIAAMRQYMIEQLDTKITWAGDSKFFK